MDTDDIVPNDTPISSEPIQQQSQPIHSNDALEIKKPEEAPLSKAPAGIKSTTNSRAETVLSGALSMVYQLGVEQPPWLVTGTLAPEEPHLEDSAIIPGHPAPSAYTTFTRYDDWQLSAVYYNNGPLAGDWASKVGTWFYDGVTLAPTTGPKVDQASAIAGMSTSSFAADPLQVKSSIFNPVAESPTFVAWLSQNIVGHKVADETAWFLRMVAIIHARETHMPMSSKAILQIFSNTPESLFEVHDELLCYPIPDDVANMWSTECYYVTSTQFSEWATSGVGFRNVAISSIYSTTVLVPIYKRDFGRWLLYLAAANFDTAGWGPYSGNHAYAVTCVNDNGPANRVTIHFHANTKATKTRLRGLGPGGRVVFVIVDETSRNEWTPPRDFGFGPVPCLVNTPQGQQDVRHDIWQTFVLHLGHQVGGQQPFGGQHPDFETDVMEAYHHLQERFNVSNSENKAQVLAAELFYDTCLRPQPQQQPQALVASQPQEPMVEGSTRRRLTKLQMVARKRAGLQARNYEIVTDQNDGLDPYRVDVAGWMPNDNDVTRGAGAYVWTNWGGVLLDTLRPQGEQAQYSFECIYRPEGQDAHLPVWEWQMLRSSPNGFLRGRQTTVIEPAPLNLPEGFRNNQAPLPVFMSIRDTGVDRMAVSAPDPLARLGAAVYIVESFPNKSRWADAETFQLYLRCLADVLGAFYQTIVIEAGLSWSTWLGLTDPVIRGTRDRHDAYWYDTLRALTFGPRVITQDQARTGAVARVIRRIPGYLCRGTNNLDEFIVLPGVYREVSAIVNKFLGPDTLPMDATRMRYALVRRLDVTQQGWRTEDKVADYMEYNLMTSSLSLAETNPHVITSLPRLANLRNCPMGFYPDYNLDRIISVIVGGVVTPVMPTELSLNAYLWCHPISETTAGNNPDLCVVRSPVILPGSGRLQVGITFPDPFWDWFWERARDVGRQVLAGNWLGAVTSAVGYLVKDVATTIRNRDWAWKEPQPERSGSGAVQGASGPVEA